jgi:hypothetical protein
MIPVGYMAKRISSSPDWLKALQVADVYSVSSCVSNDFADYINFWKHNGYWLFDSPEIIRSVALENSISLDGAKLFYYEAYEMEFTGNDWQQFLPEPLIAHRCLAAGCKDARRIRCRYLLRPKFTGMLAAFMQRSCRNDPNKRSLPDRYLRSSEGRSRRRPIQQLRTGPLSHLRRPLRRFGLSPSNRQPSPDQNRPSVT